jgi:hypothetical protein
MLERALLASQRVPTAMTESYGPAYARAIVVSTERGLFEALAAGPRTARDMALLRWLEHGAVDLSVPAGIRS